MNADGTPTHTAPYWIEFDDQPLLAISGDSYRFIEMPDIAGAALLDLVRRHNQLADALRRIVADAEDDHVVHTGDLLALLDVDAGRAATADPAPQTDTDT